MTRPPAPPARSRGPLCLCLLLLGCAAGGQGGPAGAGDLAAPPPDLAGASEVETVVRVHYPVPAGSALYLRGERAPLSWSAGAAMERLGAALFVYRMRGLAAPMAIKPLLDDLTWSRGKNFRVEPGAQVDLYPHFQRARGSFERRYRRFRSKILENERDVWVYLPPGYQENPLARYPVLYMHDGQNLFDPASAFGGVTWRVAETLDAGAEALDEEESIPQVIVVGPENAGAARLYEYTPTGGGRGGGGGDLYLRFLIEELKPRVDQELRTRPEASALAGSSLGGLISAYAGLTHGATFSRIGAFSPSTWWDDAFLIGAVLRSAGRTPRPARVYLDSGESGPGRDDADNTRRLADAYRQVGYRDGVSLLYVLDPGGQHNEASWAIRLPAALRFLLAGWQD